VNLDAALAYAARGIPVVPLIPGTKRPSVAWTEFQTRRPTADMVRSWWSRWPAAGVALVCGRVSGLAVLDIDPRHHGDQSLASFALGDGPTGDTGGGGVHVYYAIDAAVPRIVGLLPGVDLLGEASLAAAPPSVHASGRAYRWRPGRALGERPLPPLPSWLRRLIAEHQRPRPSVRSGGPHVEAPELEAILAALEGVRRNRSGWTARCPAHQDTDPSLSIGVGQGGKVLLFCFGGCTFSGIIAALGVRA
jgi:hypothetical protein